MGIHIFTKKETPQLKKAFGKNAAFFTAASKQAPLGSDISYYDITGINMEDIKKMLAGIKKSCKDNPWGIIDPKGSITDPAALFFEGASDYLGPAFFKGANAIPPKRLKDPVLWRSAQGLIDGKTKETAKDKTGNSESKTVIPKNGIKLPPASQFPGWKNIPHGKTMPFYLLYCSLQGKTALNTRLGEAVYSRLHQRFKAFLCRNLQEGDGHVWMDSGKDLLFLLPPKAKSADLAIEACIRMLLSAPLASIESFNLTIPANFIFALHYGSLSYRPPGSTGTVVSDAVNFIFHLGCKKAQPGRLTISDELPDNTVISSLEEFFVGAGEFEGRQVWHTKKFSYVKPWI